MYRTAVLTFYYAEHLIYGKNLWMVLNSRDRMSVAN